MNNERRILYISVAANFIIGIIIGIILFYGQMRIEPAVLEGGYTYEGKQVGANPSVTEAVQKGDLVELPSTRDAFLRYLALGASEDAVLEDSAGLNISPNPNTFNTRTRMNYFYSQKRIVLLRYFDHHLAGMNIN